MATAAEADFQFPGTLAELMRVVRKRAVHAGDIIAQVDDPEIIDREMRYIRPFWEFYIARRSFNRTSFWQRRARDVFADVAEPHFAKCDLMWLPCRVALGEAVAGGSQRPEHVLGLIRGLDTVLFNFIGLLGRMRYVVGIENPDSFRLCTRDGYRLLNHRLQRTANDGSEYRILSCQFHRPDGEEIKIEKDYSESRYVPHVTVRIYSSDKDAEGRTVTFDGTQKQLKSLAGGTLRAR